MGNAILKLDKIKVNVKYDNSQILDHIIREFGDFMSLSQAEEGEQLFTVNFRQMQGMGGGSGAQVHYDKEPKDKHLNKVSIFEDHVNVDYNPENDFSSFCGYVFLNSMSKLFENAGYFILHSSCVEKDGGAIAFSGRKGAGKTQTLINLLQSGYHLVTNDKLALRLGENGQIVCVGFPTSVGIRMTQNFANDPKNDVIIRTLKQKDREVLKSADAANLADESKKFFIHPRVLTTGYNTDITPISNLVQIVNPTFVPGKEKFESAPADLRELIESQREPAVSIEKPYLNEITFTPFSMDMSKIVSAMAALTTNISVQQGAGQTGDLIDVLEK